MLTGLPMEQFTKVTGITERKMDMVFSHIQMVHSMTVQYGFDMHVLVSNKLIS